MIDLLSTSSFMLLLYLIGNFASICYLLLSESCNVGHSVLKKLGCGKMYASSHEDKSNDYSVGWIKSRSSGSLVNSPWKYHSAVDLRGHPFIGKITMYGAGGFVQNLGKAASSAKAALDILKSSNWIDRFSRALFIEFTTYNNNGNFYCMVTLLLELPASGGVVPVYQIITTRLDRYNSQFSLFLGSCEVAFLLLTLYYMFLELKRFKKQKRSYFYRTRNIIELLSFALTWTSFSLLILRLGVVKWTKNSYKSSPDGFTNFQYAGAADLLYGHVFAALVVIAFLKILTILRFNKNMSLLFETLLCASKDLKYFFITFLVLFTAYIFWAHLTFLSFLQGYNNVISSSASTLNILLGSFNFKDLVNANRVIGPLFFFLFIFTMVFLLTNMFLTIVVEAFAVIRKQGKHKQNKYEIIEYFWSKIRTFVPCLLQTNLQYDKPDKCSGLVSLEDGRREDKCSLLLSKADDVEEAMKQLDAQIDTLENMISEKDAEEVKDYRFMKKSLLNLDNVKYSTSEDNSLNKS